MTQKTINNNYVQLVDPKEQFIKAIANGLFLSQKSSGKIISREEILNTISPYISTSILNGRNIIINTCPNFDTEDTRQILLPFYIENKDITLFFNPDCFITANFEDESVYLHRRHTILDAEFNEKAQEYIDQESFKYDTESLMGKVKASIFDSNFPIFLEDYLDKKLEKDLEQHLKGTPNTAEKQ